jgi:hypothetical protein
VTVLGMGGTGYLNPGPCGGDNYATRAARVPLDTEVVVLEGGLNEAGSLWYDQTRGAMAAVRARVPNARIVILGLTDMASVPEVLETSTNDVLAGTAAESDATYVNTQRWGIQIGPDRIHPTATGQRTYGRRLAQALN